MQGAEKVHEMRTQRRHTRSTADIYHFAPRILYMEISIRPREGYFVAGLARKDIGRTYTGLDTGRPCTRRTIERRRSDTDIEHDDISLGGIIGHRISPEGLLIVAARQSPHLVRRQAAVSG